MPTLTIEYTTDAEAGTVLDACERFALDRGRQLLRDQRQAAVQAHADAPQKCPATGPRG